MKLSKSTKRIVKEEREKLLLKMSDPTISQEDWLKWNERLTVYTEVLKSERKIDMNTVLVAAAGVLQVLAILNFEKAGIVVSKATNFVFKGRA